MMKISYEPLEQTLKRSDKNKSSFRHDLSLSPKVIAKIAKNEPISLMTIKRICEYLDCDLTDVVEFVKVKQDA